MYNFTGLHVKNKHLGAGYVVQWVEHLPYVYVQDTKFFKDQHHLKLDNVMVVCATWDLVLKNKNMNKKTNI